MTTNKQDTLSRIQKSKVSAIIRTDDQQLAATAMAAARDGGFRLLEFTLTTPGAFELISEFAKDNDVSVGAGTVLSVEDARRAVDAGARFLVSPIADADVIAEANKLGVVMIPGTVTPNEMVTAHKLGADLLKYFPASGDVAEYVRSILGPLPFLKIYPTSGVTPDNFLRVLEAGAFGVGFVRSLFTDADMASKNFDAIKKRASAIVDALNQSNR